MSCGSISQSCSGTEKVKMSWLKMRTFLLVLITVTVAVIVVADKDDNGGDKSGKEVDKERKYCPLEFKGNKCKARR